MGERRTVGRKSTRHLAKVIDSERNRLLGRLVNITAEGMMLVTDQAVDIYDIYHIRLTLPKMVNGQATLELQAQARGCRADRNPRFFNAGFQFVQINEEDEDLIRDVFNRFCLVG